MSESAIERSGPSLEQILWRAFDRFEERPALTDAEEFAEHIAAATVMSPATERWTEKFFEGSEKLHRPPADVAGIIVAATSERLHVHEFDLRRLEYVVLEEKEKIVVVSNFGQFTAPNDDFVTRAIEAAVIPDGGRRDRRGTEPRAYFVRAGGEIAALDVRKVAGALANLAVRQVSAPAVDRVAKRMLPFAPRRVSLDPGRESRVLRQDRRARETVPPPVLERERSGPPPTAQTAVLVVLPDGTVARPEIGSASRWQEMLSHWAARAATAGATPEPVRSRVTVQAGVVVRQEARGLPGQLGERALRFAPAATLDEDALQEALARGALVVPGRAQAARFWIHPEAAFRPDARPLGQGGQGAVSGTLVKSPQLGEVTGDSWADWALLAGGLAPPMMALRGRSRQPALDQTEAMSLAPLLAQRLRAVRPDEAQIAGARVVAFRDANGNLIRQQPEGAVGLAAVGHERPGGVRRKIADLAPRTGALPATALAMLQMALERTASAGGYKLPFLRLGSASDALEAGSAMQLDVSDPRRRSARLAGPISFSEGPSGQVAQLVLSMPFPNQSELHVGDDLSEALQAYLGGPVQPARAASGGAVFRLRAGQLDSSGEDRALDWSALNSQATRRAQDAVITLELPSVQPLVRGASSVSGLPALLQRALEQRGDWTPGPGAPMPLAIRELAFKGPFEDLPADLTAGAPAQAPRRPISPGEEEIVIPLPLWAQMGRRRSSATDQILASPLAREGYAPPLGAYRLVVPLPYGGPADYTGGAPAGTTGLVQLVGPTRLELVARSAGIAAQRMGGRFLLGTVAIDDRAMAVGRRGGGAILGSGPAPALAAPRFPQMDAGSNLPPLSGALSGSRAMAGALQSAVRMSDNVDGRLPTGPRSSPAKERLSESASDARHGGPFYLGWSHSTVSPRSVQNPGGVHLSSLAGSVHPSLPRALRFRYAGAPLWWSTGGEADSDSTPAARSMRSGLHAATLAASIWRSLLVSGQSGGAGDGDAGPDASADQSNLGGIDRLSATSLVAGGARDVVATGGAAYVAMNNSGAAGPVSQSAVARAKANFIEMSIVAAIPPAPPPLESMGSRSEVAHPRQRQEVRAGPRGHDNGQDEGVSQSEIEGSVDAIAQRIYHRVRRRIENDRERFGG